MQRLAALFGAENVFVELQDAGLPEQRELLPKLARLAERAGLRTVATNDVHYLRHEDAYAHDALLCIQTQSNLDDEDRMRFSSDEFYFKTADEMYERFKDYPGACEATAEIAARCDVSLDFGTYLLPSYPVPEGTTEGAYLRELCEQGIVRRYGAEPAAEVRERLDFELGVIGEMGFDAYFLIVWDYVKFAKDNGIAVGPGRGSAAGSIVSYALGITDIDPLRYDLLFERFLNPGRKSMPDIDMDFSVARREEVIDYVADKYGRDRVAQIITFGTMAARAAVRDAARVMGKPYAVGDKIAKMIPEQAPPATFSQAMLPGGELKQAYDADAEVKEVVDLAMSLEGPHPQRLHPRRRRGHQRQAAHRVPSAAAKGRGRAGHAVRHERRRQARAAQDGLSRLAQPRRHRGGARDHRADRRRVHRDRPAAARRREDLQDAGPRRLHRRVPVREPRHERGAARRRSHRVRRPHRHRSRCTGPGPMQYIPAYARNKRDPASVVYDHEALRPILEPTHGVTIYQEQYMAIARRVGGFSPAQADDLRKAISKKNQQLMATLKEPLMAGSRREWRAAGREPASCGPTSRPPATTRSTRATPPATR